jgi:hypothetical protein
MNTRKVGVLDIVLFAAVGTLFAYLVGKQLKATPPPAVSVPPTQAVASPELPPVPYPATTPYDGDPGKKHGYLTYFAYGYLHAQDLPQK